MKIINGFRRSSRVLFPAMAAIAALILTMSLHGQTAGSPERTDTPTPTPTEQVTPLPSVPAAPTDVDHLGGVLTWTDNSDNEDGFEIRVFCDSEPVLAYRVPANTTRYQPPPEAQVLFWEGCSRNCPQIAWEVTPFNAAGRGESMTVALIRECVMATNTPSTVVLPGTGNPTGTTDTHLALVVSAIGVGFLAAGVAWGVKRFVCWRTRI